jgi:NADH-quinone oxidoreductase subunit G
MQNIQPKGDGRPEWEFLHELTRHVTASNGFSTIEGLFNEMAAAVPAFQGLTWAALGDLGVTVPI